MGFVLFIVALTLVGVIGVIGFISTLLYYFFTLKWEQGYDASNKFMYKLALSIDQFGNVACAVPFGYLLIKKFGIPFGDEDDTISYILALNRDRGTLTTLGKWLAYILDVLDTDHLDKAIELKIEKDRLAYERYLKVLNG